MGTENRTYSGGAIGTCMCNLYFYDDGSNELCPPCHYSCTICNGTTLSTCTDCGVNGVTFRTINTTNCPCDIGYYDDTSSRNCG